MSESQTQFLHFPNDFTLSYTFPVPACCEKWLRHIVYCVAFALQRICPHRVPWGTVGTIFPRAVSSDSYSVTLYRLCIDSAAATQSRHWHQGRKETTVIIFSVNRANIYIRDFQNGFILLLLNLLFACRICIMSWLIDFSLTGFSLQQRWLIISWSMSTFKLATSLMISFFSFSPKKHMFILIIH